MRRAELVQGRTFGVIFDRGEDFFTALAEFCEAEGVRQGYIPMFLGAFSSMELVGTCERREDPAAPVWSGVHVSDVEAVGCGTLAYDPEAARVLPHVHASAGPKGHSALAHTSHLLGATVHFVTELLVVEVLDPGMRRPPKADMYDVPLLEFGR